MVLLFIISLFAILAMLVGGYIFLMVWAYRDGSKVLFCMLAAIATLFAVALIV